MEVIMGKRVKAFNNYEINKNIVGINLEDKKKKEKQIKAAIKKAMIKKFTKIKRKVNNG